MTSVARATGGGARPKYAEIVRRLRDEVRSQPPGTKVPTERELAQRFAVSRMTLRQALDALEVEGRIARVRGSGTFVRRPTVTMGPTLISFTEEMRARGLRPSARLLRFDEVAAEPPIADALALGPGDRVVMLERLRFVDGEPLCVEVSHLPGRYQRTLEEGDLEQSLHALLREAGVEIGSGTRRIRATSARLREARLLGVADGAPTLEVFDVFYDSSGRPVQRAVSRYHADRHEVVTHLQRTEA